MAHYITWNRPDGTVSNWETDILEGRLVHKHQETLYVRWKNYLCGTKNKKSVIMDKIEFSYTAAKKFLTRPIFENLPWFIESEDPYFHSISNREKWKKYLETSW